MKKVLSFCILTAIAGCADYQINTAEKNARKGDTSSSLRASSNYADRLSNEYMNAAKHVSGFQDAFAFLTFAAAGSVVVGAAGTTGDTVLAKRAVAGAMSSQAATRTTPKDAIKSIYQAAKQLNCVSTIAGLGADIGVDDQTAAITLTQGAIDYIRISARERVVRDVADYSTIVQSLKDSVSRSTEEAGGGGRTKSLRDSVKSFDEYAKMLAICTASTDPKPSDAAKQ